MMDFPAAWRITLASKMTDHDPRCSYPRAGMLCDCHVLKEAQRDMKPTYVMICCGEGCMELEAKKTIHTEAMKGLKFKWTKSHRTLETEDRVIQYFVDKELNEDPNRLACMELCGFNTCARVRLKQTVARMLRSRVRVSDGR